MDNLKDKKILILGAGRGQIGLYKAARNLGIKTIAATMPDNNPPCIPLADEVCYVNILNPDEVEKETSSLEFDGVATCCLDKGLKALGRLSDKRNLVRFPEDVADLCNNKFLMKQRFAEKGVTTAPFTKISKEDDLSTAIEKVGGFPVMIKATDLAGSRGIYKVETLEEAKEAFHKAMAETKKDFIIVERCLKGREFGAQAFVQNGEVVFVMPHGDILFHSATDVPVGHYAPFDGDEALLHKIKDESIKAIHAVGLDNCAVNLDFIEEDGQVYVLELSGRIGANGLPEVVSGYYGINYYEMVILAALGIPVNQVWDNHGEGEPVMSRMIYSEDLSGELESIYLDGPMEDYITELNFFVKPGSSVHKFENTTHCIGEFVVKGTDVQDCQRLADQTLSNIKINLRNQN